MMISSDSSSETSETMNVHYALYFAEEPRELSYLDPLSLYERLARGVTLLFTLI